MGKAFDFKIGGLDKLTSKLEKLPEDLKQNIDGAIKSNIVDINAEQVRRTPIDRAEIRNNTGFIKEKGNKEIIEYALFSNAPHAQHMEFGTRKKFKAIPGVDTPDYTKQKGTAVQLYENILAWVKRKGIGAQQTKSGAISKSLDSQAGMENAARAIWLSILRHGVKPQPFFYGPFLAAKDKIVKDVSEQIKHL